jgi:hypothetical protein
MADARKQQRINDAYDRLALAFGAERIAHELLFARDDLSWIIDRARMVAKAADELSAAASDYADTVEAGRG